MALTPLHVRDVCRAGSWDIKKCCRFLTQEVRKDGTWISLCTKLSPAKYKKMPQEILPGIKRSSLPSNCEGLLYLKHIEQGFDKKD